MQWNLDGGGQKLIRKTERIIQKLIFIGFLVQILNTLKHLVNLKTVNSKKN